MLWRPIRHLKREEQETGSTQAKESIRESKQVLSENPPWSSARGGSSEANQPESDDLPKLCGDLNPKNVATQPQIQDSDTTPVAEHQHISLTSHPLPNLSQATLSNHTVVVLLPGHKNLASIGKPLPRPEPKASPAPSDDNFFQSKATAASQPTGALEESPVSYQGLKTYHDPDGVNKHNSEPCHLDALALAYRRISASKGGAQTGRVLARRGIPAQDALTECQKKSISHSSVKGAEPTIGPQVKPNPTPTALPRFNSSYPLNNATILAITIISTLVFLFPILCFFIVGHRHQKRGFKFSWVEGPNISNNIKPDLKFQSTEKNKIKQNHLSPYEIY